MLINLFFEITIQKGLKQISLLIACMWMCALGMSGCNKKNEKVEPPENPPVAQPSDIWIRPVEGEKGNPCWGFKDGIQIGLAPLSGPRGLIRLYAPYADQPHLKPFNFIAFEPVNHNNVKGFSEMETSRMDEVQGLRFWSGNSPNANEFPAPEFPAAGKITWTGNQEKLSVYIFSEKFANGSDVYVKATFTAGRPYEVELTTYRPQTAQGVKYFILSATMGNYARLRQLHLKDNRVKTAQQLWPSYTGTGFTNRDVTNKSDMITDAKGGVWFIASPSEDKPWEAVYAPGTAANWIYRGTTYVTQYLYCPQPQSMITGQVNGRYSYWLSSSPIPGGIAFENFELVENFQIGASYRFGLYPGKPEELIRKIERGEY